MVDALRVHDGRWFTLLGAAASGAGVPYDVSAHPFVAAAVLDGRVLHDSRDQLAATLDSRPDEVAAIERALPLPRASGDMGGAAGRSARDGVDGTHRCRGRAAAAVA